jgi:hypothetical protein
VIVVSGARVLFHANGGILTCHNCQQLMLSTTYETSVADREGTSVMRTGCSADHSGRAVYGTNCLRSLKHWDRVLESHLRHGCLCVFILFVFCVEVEALQRVDHSTK